VLFFEPSDDPVLRAVEHPGRLVARQVKPGAFRFDIRLRGGDETPFFDD
jgi:protocatechuate 3,4-dioxygenase beta subunit